MPQRFTIEDIEVQDSTGVIFRATDTETGRTVAVRRFFPFGPTGGGLTMDEQDEYASALEHLETIAHPALRAIVSGGCDPVDGMPFIATEWVEGTSLRHILATRPLTRSEATALLVRALEACEALSAVLGREGVWIETDPQTIIIGAEDTHRPVTFWISPLRWLGQLSGQRGMEPLVTLTETAMGWVEPPDSHGSTGLASWLRWLREAGRNVSLAEARERLLANVGKDSGPATHRLVQPATRAAVPGGKSPRKKSNASAWILACCILTAAGLAGRVVIQKNNQRNANAEGSVVEVESPAPRVIPKRSNRSPEESEARTRSPQEEFPASVEVGGRDQTPEEMTSRAAERSAQLEEADRLEAEHLERIRKRGDVYLADEGGLLLKQNKGSLVKIEGKLAKVHTTAAGFVYLSFSMKPGNDEPQGYVDKDDSSPDLTESSLRHLVGRTIRMEGDLRKNKKTGPEVRVRTRSAIIEP